MATSHHAAGYAAAPTIYPVEATIRPHVQSLLLFLPVVFATGALVFLVAAGFFTAWDGKAVSVRPSANLAPETWQVLVANTDGTHGEFVWPASAVAGLGLPFDSIGVPPTRVPDTRPDTRKSRFSLFFVVERPSEAAPARDEGDVSADAPAPVVSVVQLANLRAVGAGVIVSLLVLLIRNMAYSGHPLSILPRAPGRLLTTPADEQPPSGTSDDTRQGPRAGRPTRPGPPPPPRRRGQGRR